ncbi:MAG: hypothetical protein WCA49_02895 [Candidatus Sulfotelmatobacter sp.]
MSLEHRSGRPFHNIPTKRQGDYNLWLQTMAEQFPGAEARIHEKLTRYVNGWLAEKGEIPHAAFCSSWIPGPDWGRGDEVYQPMYETMMHLYNEDGLAHPRAGWLFGLILMDLMIRRPDYWECWHEAHEPEDSPEGLYYRPCRRQITQAG